MWNCHKTETVGKLSKTVWSNDTDSCHFNFSTSCLMENTQTFSHWNETERELMCQLQIVQSDVSGC